MRGAVIVMLRSRVLWKVHSKDHAVTAPSSTTTSPPALHHYQGRNFTPGRLPSSTSASRSQFRRHDSAEVGRDLLDRSLAATSDRHDVRAELLGIGPGHGAHPSSGALRHHRSGVTYPCSRPDQPPGWLSSLLYDPDGPQTLNPAWELHRRDPTGPTTATRPRAEVCARICARSRAPVAQGIEHRSPKAGVGSSNLPRRTEVLLQVRVGTGAAGAVAAGPICRAMVSVWSATCLRTCTACEGRGRTPADSRWRST